LFPRLRRDGFVAGKPDGNLRPAWRGIGNLAGHCRIDHGQPHVGVVHRGAVRIAAPRGQEDLARPIVPVAASGFLADLPGCQLTEDQGLERVSFGVEVHAEDDVVELDGPECGLLKPQPAPQATWVEPHGRVSTAEDVLSGFQVRGLSDYVHGCRLISSAIENGLPR